jgi:hypothetical protein
VKKREYLLWETAPINRRLLILIPSERGKRRFSTFSTNLVTFSVNGYQHHGLTKYQIDSVLPNSRLTCDVTLKPQVDCLVGIIRGEISPQANACP